MKREPSIHITRSDLIKILKINILPEGVDCDGLAKLILRLSKPYSLHTRTIVVSTDKMEKNAKRILECTRRDADLFAQLVYAIRKEMRHRGISLLKVGSKEWGFLKEVTAHALNFYNEFEFETKRAAFLRYIRIGANKMKKFRLTKFLNMYESICESHLALVEIERDDDIEMTKEIYTVYSRYIINHTGVYDRLEEIPEKYVWFVKAREEAKNLNVSVKVYMNAQLEAFDLSTGIPHPAQLVGPKAVDRVIAYMYKNGIKIQT